MEDNKKKDIKVIKGENNNKAVLDKWMMIDELEDRIESMKSDKEKKCESAKEQLVNMLEITADKYRTATGTAEALRIVRFVNGEERGTVYDANNFAWSMADVAYKMAEKARELPYEKMDELCDGFYEREFKSSFAADLIYEMMRIDLCRNVGSAAEDMVEFIKRVDAEIEETEKKLAELKDKKE